MLQVGDRVRLTEKAGRMAQKAKFNYQRNLDWTTRCGTLVRIAKWTDFAMVVWDGRKSGDQWPISTLEKVP